MKSGRTIVIVALIALVIGMMVSSEARPAPEPPNRPVLSWIARAAKSLLWIAVFAEPPRNEVMVHHQAIAGEDGYIQVEHCEAW